jgi:DNA-binding transcriptional MocR family regulator
MTTLATTWLADGTARQVEKHRREDARLRQQLAARLLEGLDYQAHPASPFGWLRLPSEPRPVGLAHALAERGVLVSTADAFAVGPQISAALRISLASPPSPHVLEEALREVRSVLAC